MENVLRALSWHNYSTWQKFSEVCLIVLLYRRWSSEPAFENTYLCVCEKYVVWIAKWKKEHVHLLLFVSCFILVLSMCCLEMLWKRSNEQGVYSYIWCVSFIYISFHIHLLLCVLWVILVLSIRYLKLLWSRPNERDVYICTCHMSAIHIWCDTYWLYWCFQYATWKWGLR